MKSVIWVSSVIAPRRPERRDEGDNALVAPIRAWIADRNDDPKPCVWHKSADEILASLAAYYQRINDAGH